MSTRVWNSGYEASPGDNDLLSEGDNRIREIKLDVRERLAKGGHVMQDSTSGSGNKDGRHAVGVGDGPHIYKTDQTTKVVEFSNSGVKVTGTLEVSGQATIGSFDLGMGQSSPVISVALATPGTTTTLATVNLAPKADPGPVLVCANAQIYRTEPVTVSKLDQVFIECDRGSSGSSWELVGNYFLSMAQGWDPGNSVPTLSTISFTMLDVDGVNNLVGGTAIYRLRARLLAGEITVRHPSIAAVELLQ